MKGRLSGRIRLAALALALLGQLGAPCNPGGPPSGALVALIPDTIAPGTLAPLEVEIAVNAPMPIQAVDVSIRWDPSRLFAYLVTPHVEFDDDGQFFVGPTFDSVQGRLEGIVDLRHGGAGATDTFRVATVYFFTHELSGPTSIEFIGAGLAGPDGSEPPTTLVPVEVTIGP